MFTNPHATQTLAITLVGMVIIMWAFVALVGSDLVSSGLRRRRAQAQIWLQNNVTQRRWLKKRQPGEYQGRHRSALAGV